jgi:hypothetical protein
LFGRAAYCSLTVIVRVTMPTLKLSRYARLDRRVEHQDQAV